MPTLKLVCVHPFHKFEVGQEVTDPAEVNRLNTSEHEHHFVRVNVPDPPADETSPTADQT
jgi:hypothetical protein